MTMQGAAIYAGLTNGHGLNKLDVILALFAGFMVAAAGGFAFILSQRFPAFKAPTFKTAKEWMEHSWLAGLPSTNFKSFTTVALYFLTFIAWAAALLLEKDIDNVSFGMWLGFLAGLGGFALAQFSKQRDTDYGAMERRAAIEAAKAGNGPAVTVAATNATVNTDGATAPPAPADSASTPPATSTP